MTDRDLGMHAGITRRDFLDGVAITALGALAAGSVPACAPHHLPTGAANTAAYPPATTGLWGQDNSSYAVMHKPRAGTFWTHTKAPSSSDEHYDLVIVGAGMSGLASAYFYRQQRPNARILILDVRRDFGGHAGRNEFRVGDRLLLSNAGTQSMESPSGYRPSAIRLVKELGIDLNRFYKYFQQHRYDSLSTGLFFNRRTFGRNHFVAGAYQRPWHEVFRDVPLSQRAKSDLVRIHIEQVDYLPHLSREQKVAYLKTISYSTFITKHAECDRGVLPYLQDRPYDLLVRVSKPSLRMTASKTVTTTVWSIPAFRAWISASVSASGVALNQIPIFSISPTAMRPSLACLCARSCPAPFQDRRWKISCSRRATTQSSMTRATTCAFGSIRQPCGSFTTQTRRMLAK